MIDVLWWLDCYVICIPVSYLSEIQNFRRKMVSEADMIARVLILGTSCIQACQSYISWFSLLDPQHIFRHSGTLIKGTQQNAVKSFKYCAKLSSDF